MQRKNRQISCLLLALLGAGTLPAFDAGAEEAKKSGAHQPSPKARAAIDPLEKPLRDAEMLLQNGRVEAGYALLAALEKERAGEVRFDYLLGIAALDSNRPDQAVAALLRVLAAKPDYTGARLELARSYYQLGDLPRAKIEFETGLAQNPSEAAQVAIRKYLEIIHARSVAAQKQPAPALLKAAPVASTPSAHEDRVAAMPTVQQPAVPAVQAATSVAVAADTPPASGGAATEQDGNTARVRIERFEVKGNTLLDPGLIERLLAPHKGSAQSYADIQRALEALEGAYRNAGYSAVHVVTPEQEITEGTVILQVIEALIGKVALSGNDHYDTANIRSALPALREGATPNARALSENIRLANENPTRQIDVVLAIGEAENTIDARVNVQDSSPHKAFLTLDNTGSASTGMYRAGVGYQHNNLFNRDHAATFNYITSPSHISDVTQFSASYRLPLYAVGDSVDLIAAYSDTNAGTTATVAGPLAFSGRGRIYSAHYNHYLPRKGEYTARIIAGLDYRAYDNECSLGAFGASGCGSAAFDVTVHPASLAYNGTLTRPAYVFDYTATAMRNIPGGTNGKEASFNAVRPSPTGGEGAGAGYSLLRLNGSLAGVLPDDWQFRLAGNAQYTRKALVSGESFGVVGANAVRGFTEREMFSSDKGYVLNVELYAPDLARDLKVEGGSFRLLGFIDWGGGWNQPLAGESGARSSAGSVGAGFRFGLGKNISTRFDYARIVEATGTSKAGDMRGHFSFVGSW